MSRKIIPLDSFTPETSHKILLDTNILIDLFYSTNFESASNSYEILYKQILAQKCELLISSIQVSEFINRCIRLQYALYKKEHNCPTLEYKKEYRSTDEYRDKMKAILDIIRTDIIKHFTFINDDFNQMQQDKIFLYGFSYDFNDALLTEIAQQQNAILVTNDFDFANYKSDFPIVTSNKFLLMTH